MKKRTTDTDFEARLRELTDTHHSSLWFFMPFPFSGKPFYGTFDGSTFHVRRTSQWSHVRSVVIKGRFKKRPGGWTDVTYDVGLSWTARTFSWVVLGGCMVGFNVVLYANRATVEAPAFFALNGFFIFAALLSMVMSKIGGKIAEERFETAFDLQHPHPAMDTVVFTRLYTED